MKQVTSLVKSSATDTVANDRNRNSTAGDELSIARLNLLRIGYLVTAVGLAITKWPLLINHPSPWDLMEGVETCMLVALSLLSILGLRYPVRMLPMMFFEIGWKVIWTLAVALPLWTADQMDEATLQVFYACVWVLIIVAVVPWRYVLKNYVTRQGDPWRTATAPRSH